LDLRSFQAAGLSFLVLLCCNLTNRHVLFCLTAVGLLLMARLGGALPHGKCNNPFESDDIIQTSGRRPASARLHNNIAHNLESSFCSFHTHKELVGCNYVGVCITFFIIIIKQCFFNPRCFVRSKMTLKPFLCMFQVCAKMDTFCKPYMVIVLPKFRGG